MNLQTPYRYPLDKTGLNPNNLVVDELHTLPNLAIRCIAPTYGGFYSESVIVKDYVTGRKLIHDVDYKFGEILELPSDQTAKEICGYIVIYNTQVSKVTLTYQALGGEYSYSMDSIIEMLNSLDLGNRPVQWGLIVGRPVDFPPTSHFHPSSDIYGMEYVVHSLERVRQAVLMGDVASHDEIYAYIDRSNGEITAVINAVRAELLAHIADKNNPHNTTKAQVGLGSVQDYDIATNIEAVAGTLNTKYMTPLRVMESINNMLIPVNAHIANTSNPHNTTKAQVGLGSVQDYGIATTVEAQQGTSNIKYMTPLRVKEAIDIQAVAPLNAHIADTNNPHNTTKAQVGLSAVQNYGIATKVDAETGSSNILYMTPLRVKEAITIQAVGPLNAHINNQNNPHNTTKAQVGLDLVENFPIATTPEATAGTSDVRYMTPLKVKNAIDTMAVNPLNAHIANTSNPHNTTATQVGLGSVDNFATATSSDATTGTASNKFMTPLRVKEAIDRFAITSPNFSTDISSTGIVYAAVAHAFKNAGEGASDTGFWWEADGVMQVRCNGVAVVRYSPAESRFRNQIFTENQTAPMYNGNYGAPIQIYSTGDGDGNTAGIMFNANGHCSKLVLRNDGIMGFGGASQAAWRWYVDQWGNTTAAGDVTAYSDPDLKERFEKIENPEELMELVEGCIFHWKHGIEENTGRAGNRDYGMLADQVEAHFPEFVHYSKASGTRYRTVAYHKFIPLIVEAFKAFRKKTNQRLDMLERALRVQNIRY